MLKKKKSHPDRLYWFNLFSWGDIFPTTEVVPAALSIVWPGSLPSHHPSFFTETSFTLPWAGCWRMGCISTFPTFDPWLGGLRRQTWTDKRVYLTNRRVTKGLGFISQKIPDLSPCACGFSPGASYRPNSRGQGLTYTLSLWSDDDSSIGTRTARRLPFAAAPSAVRQPVDRRRLFKSPLSIPGHQNVITSWVSHLEFPINHWRQWRRKGKYSLKEEKHTDKKSYLFFLIHCWLKKATTTITLKYFNNTPSHFCLDWLRSSLKKTIHHQVSLWLRRQRRHFWQLL